MAEGHPDAWDYTIGRIFLEAEIVEDRKAAMLAELTKMMHLAMLSTPNMGADPKAVEKNFGTLNKVTDLMLGR